MQGKGLKAGIRSVLLVGNPSLQLKGFDTAITVLAAVNKLIPLHITWLCQTQPTAALVPTLPASGLQIHLHINPPQVTAPHTNAAGLSWWYSLVNASLA